MIRRHTVLLLALSLIFCTAALAAEDAPGVEELSGSEEVTTQTGASQDLEGSLQVWWLLEARAGFEEEPIGACTSYRKCMSQCTEHDLTTCHFLCTRDCGNDGDQQ